MDSSIAKKNAKPVKPDTKNDKKSAKPMMKIGTKENITAYLFLLPSMVLFVTFVVAPIITGVFTSFFNYSIGAFDFIGLQNYQRLISDTKFLQAFKNTVQLVVLSVPLIIVFSLFVSMTIYERSSFVRSLFRAIFYLPVVTGTVSVVVVWKWIFDPLTGVLNYVLMGLGITQTEIMWLGDKRFAMLAIITVLLTTSVGQPIILYIAALGNIDSSQVEASRIDGANEWQVFRHIKWPGILPTTLYVVVVTTINTFQCFSLIQLLTSGGPDGSTSTIMYSVYMTAFSGGWEFGYANSMGVVLAVCIGLFSIFQFKVFGSNVEY